MLYYHCTYFKKKQKLFCYMTRSYTVCILKCISNWGMITLPKLAKSWSFFSVFHVLIEERINPPLVTNRSIKCGRGWLVFTFFKMEMWTCGNIFPSKWFYCFWSSLLCEAVINSFGCQKTTSGIVPTKKMHLLTTPVACSAVK